MEVTMQAGNLKSVGLLSIVPILLFSGLSVGQNAQKGDEGITIRAKVEMVSLPVVVTDKMGKRITDLTKSDFRVFENGIEQEIAGFAATDEPVSVALLLDTSGSTELKLAKIQNAAIQFVHQLHPDDEVAVLSFADDVRLQTDFSINRDRNEYGIKKTRTGEWTVAYEAVWLALEDVLKPIRTRKALVLFSDGVDTRSHKATEKETLDLAKETHATIYCVYFDTQGDLGRQRNLGSYPPYTFPPIVIAPPGPVYGGGSGSTSDDYHGGREYLKKLAEYSGGLMFNGLQDLSYAFAEVARELASQYSIGYYPTDNKHDGKFRNIAVRLNKPGLIARTKKGYFAPKDRSK